MSRIGKKPIPIPKDVSIDIKGDSLLVKGPKGELRQKIHPGVGLSREDDQLIVTVNGDTRKSHSLHGLFRALVSNMVTGVSQGFQRELEIVGVGYRGEISGTKATFHLGYSHPIVFQLPDGIEAKIEKTKITLSGIDKELLGRTAAKIRNFRAPEPYKGKGIKYAEENIRRKAGKTGAK
ncbi:MAG: 50S ribosomal protein L6 [Deltaproteobacteria bacterium]|nr:50S ribosomal protein L6 [Deltaproteobacteria bacterium]MBW2138217.1 50S ribosomal protein L6 [Deltaproteobacteria bacterium]